MNLNSKVLTLAGALLLGCSAFGQETFTIPNGTPSIDAAGDANNAIITVNSTVPAYALGKPNIVSGDVTEIATATFVSEARIRMTCSAHPGDFADIQFSATGGYTGTFALTPGPVAAFTGTLVGKTISPGDVLSFEFFESFQDGNPDVSEQDWNNLVFSTTVFTPPTPPPFTDLGNVPTSRSNSSEYAAAETKWFKFTTTQATGGVTDFLIHTRPTTTFLGGAFGDNDTEIGLYNEIGTLLFTNDDEDFAANILTSLLSFGPSGLNGELPAGVYYLAVGGFNMTFGNEFAVTNASTATGTIELRLDWGGGGGGGDRTISGTVNLQNLVTDPSPFSCNWVLLDSTNSEVQSGSTTLDSSGNYSINVTPTIGTGYSLVMKGVHWLNQLNSGINLNSNATGVNFSLINGDSDNDNEVGPGDFAALTSAFGTSLGDGGYDNNADLDNDEEVGPSDFSILSTNFGQSGDY